MKRQLAASIVVTVGMLAACNPRPPERPECCYNPPRPDVVIDPTPDPDPIVDNHEHPPVLAALPKAPVGEAGELEREGKQCFWQPAEVEMSCPEGASCNPPPPPERYEVECPKEDPNLPEAPAHVMVQTRPNGTCFYYEHVGNTGCPPHIHCNPPPLQTIDVRCPTQ